MKKLFALLLAMMMLFSLAACGDNNTTDADKDNPGVSQNGEMQGDSGSDVEDQNADTGNQGDIPKTDKSRTLDLYKEYFSGPYTLKVETYLKDIRDPDTKYVSSTTFTVVDGTKSYIEIISSTSPDNKISTLIMDGYKYTVYDEMKLIMRSAVRSNDAGTVMVMQEEEFYTDMLGNVEKREIYGEEYECEVFSNLGETVTYCYKGDELKYIIGDNGGVDVIMGVLELKKGADSTYFELPEDYDKNY